MAEIVMPRLSDTMEEGTILRWLKADGEEVARGEELVEIETDKATMTYESDQAGNAEIVAGEGDTLPVGARSRAWATGASERTAAAVASPRPLRRSPGRWLSAGRERARRGAARSAPPRQRAPAPQTWQPTGTRGPDPPQGAAGA